MIKMKFAALAVAILAALVVSASAQQPTQSGSAIPDGKVAVINTGAFASQIGELKQKYDQVDNQFKDRYQKLQTLDQQVKQLETDLQTKANALSPDKIREMQINYEDLKKRGTRDYEDFKSDYNKAIGTSTKPVWDKIGQFMQTYAAQRGIVLVIDLPGAAQTGSLAYVDPKTNITDDFISEYNKSNPVPGAAPASQPSSAAQKPASKPAGRP